MHVLCANLTQARLHRLTCERASNLDSKLTHTNPVVHAPDLIHVCSKAILPHVILLGAMSGRSSLEVSVWQEGKSAIVLQRHVHLCVMNLVRDVFWPA